ncbi:unnamed protein product [Schistosoma margrebowiei]|uniref:Uncharacterized protein n=1 Tax=Schistosoma margrebowiei TaxID=48269 RepID=A0A183LLF2_9TREM|nr:unnamed protein product [Schistosoma margrebowiei]
MLVGGSQPETLNPGFVLFCTRQQGEPIILRELVLLDGLDPVSPSFTIKDDRLGYPESCPEGTAMELLISGTNLTHASLQGLGLQQAFYESTL